MLLYLDPGTGSLLIQFFVAAVTAIIIFFKSIKFRIKYLFELFFKNNHNDEDK